MKLTVHLHLVHFLFIQYPTGWTDLAATRTVLLFCHMFVILAQGVWGFSYYLFLHMYLTFYIVLQMGWLKSGDYTYLGWERLLFGFQ